MLRSTYPGSEAVSEESTGNKLVQIVQKIQIFKGLTTDQIRKVLASCSHKIYQAGDLVCRNNTPSDDMFILIAGELAVVTVEGIRVATISPVTTVGEMGVFTGQPRSATVEATRKSNIFSIRRIQLEQMLRDDQKMRVMIYRQVVDVLAGKLTGDNVRLRDYQIDKGSSEDRLAMLERQLELEQKRMRIAIQLGVDKGDVGSGEIELYLSEKLKDMLQCVLVVDDEPEFRRLVREVLSAYSVTEAENGHQALSVLREEKIDLVITDIRMPEMDGFGLLENVRGQFPSIPVLATSGYVDAEELQESGFDGFIEKPVSLDKLQRIVEATLDKNK
jgi:CheY-like chemotaxis protein